MPTSLFVSCKFKRGLFTWQKRPIKFKRDLFIWQKRPIAHTKETYRYTSIPEACVCVSAKRALITQEKRPTNISIPQVCVSVKRDLWYAKRGLLLFAYLRFANDNRPLLPDK